MVQRGLKNAEAPTHLRPAILDSLGGEAPTLVDLDLSPSMDLEGIMLSEMSNRGRQILDDLSYM